VVETSFHSLNKGMEGLASRLPEEVLCIDFLKEAMPKSSTQQRSLRTLAQHLMAQLLSLQEPCVVKMALKGRYQYEFD
jgi:hypothetical protein